MIAAALIAMLQAYGLAKMRYLVACRIKAARHLGQALDGEVKYEGMPHYEVTAFKWDVFVTLPTLIWVIIQSFGQHWQVFVPFLLAWLAAGKVLRALGWFTNYHVHRPVFIATRLLTIALAVWVFIEKLAQ